VAVAGDAVAACTAVAARTDEWGRMPNGYPEGINAVGVPIADGQLGSVGLAVGSHGDQLLRPARTMLIAPSMVRVGVVVVAQAWARPRTRRYTSSTVTSRRISRAVAARLSTSRTVERRASEVSRTVGGKVPSVSSDASVSIQSASTTPTFAGRVLSLARCELLGMETFESRALSLARRELLGQHLLRVLRGGQGLGFGSGVTFQGAYLTGKGGDVFANRIAYRDRLWPCWRSWRILGPWRSIPLSCR